MAYQEKAGSNWPRFHLHSGLNRLDSPFFHGILATKALNSLKIKEFT